MFLPDKTDHKEECHRICHSQYAADTHCDIHTGKGGGQRIINRALGSKDAYRHDNDGGNDLQDKVNCRIKSNTDQQSVIIKQLSQSNGTEKLQCSGEKRKNNGQQDNGKGKPDRTVCIPDEKTKTREKTVSLNQKEWLSASG